MNINNLSKKIDAGIRKAVADAIAKHKMLGESIAIWKDGKVVILPASKIKLPTTKKSK